MATGTPDMDYNLSRSIKGDSSETAADSSRATARDHQDEAALRHRTKQVSGRDQRAKHGKSSEWAEDDDLRQKRKCPTSTPPPGGLESSNQEKPLNFSLTPLRKRMGKKSISAQVEKPGTDREEG